MKKRLFLIALIVLMVSSIVFCAVDSAVWSGKPVTKAKKIGYIGMDEGFAFFYSMRILMEQIAKDNNFEAYILDAKFNTTTFMENIEQLIALRVDAALINSWDEGVGAAAIAKLKAAGIPTVILHVEPYGNKDVPIVNMDDYTGGFIVGQEMARLWKKNNPKVTPVYGIITNTDSVTNSARTKGMKDAFLKAFPKAKLAAELDGGYTQEGSMKAAEDLLTAHPKTNVWFTAHTVQGNGVLMALKTRGKDTWPKSIIGCGDANPQNADYLSDPKCALKVGMGNSPKTMLEIGWEILKDYMVGKKVPLHTQYELKAITDENAEEFLESDFPTQVK